MKGSVLVVDDDPDIRDILALTLEQRGFDVETAANGREALERLEIGFFDIVVLDIEMPDMTGLEVCQELRRTSEIPVIFLTARVQTDDRISGLEVGGDDYVTKPFDPDELVARIAAVLRRTQRKPALGQTIFKHYCSACLACVTQPKQPCPECESEPAPDGWPEIADSRYQYLGREIAGRYVLDRFLGAGGMGEVYRARAKEIDRYFACKIIDTSAAALGGREEAIRRFRQEVDAMSRLRNPHVVAIYEAMHLQSGVFTFFMDYVSGRTLGDLLDLVGRLTTQRALSLARQVANGLHEAHELGLVHRDLKPDNIMVERLPASGYFARILDFGIVHIRDSAGATEGFHGTPLYASPEQCLGDKNIDRRSDIYSLGCVLFHCLAGEPVFSERTALKIMEAHVRTPPRRIADVIGPGRVPEILEQLLSDMLAKAPDSRPPDLAAVIERIDAIVDDSSPREPDTSPRPEQTLEHFAVDSEAPPPAIGSGPSVKTAGSSQIVAPIKLYDLAGGAAEVKAFTAFALSADGSTAAVADQAQRIHVVPLRQQGPAEILEGATGPIVALAVDPRDRSVVAAQLDGFIWRWELGKEDHARPITRLPDRVNVLLTGPPGLLIFGTESGRVAAIDVRADGTERPLLSSDRPIRAIGWSSEDEKIVVGLRGGELRSVDLRGRSAAHLCSLRSDARTIAISPDGYLGAVLDEEDDITIVNLADGRALFTMHAAVAALKSLVFGEQNRLLGLGAQQKKIGLWEVEGARNTIA